MELSRIISHLVWLGTTCIDIGAFTPFLWAFQERERVYTLLEQWIGARLTTTLTRVGGMGADIPDGWMDGLTRLRAHASRRRSTKSTAWSRGTASGWAAPIGLGRDDAPRRR